MIRTAVFALSFLMNLRFKQVNDVPIYIYTYIHTHTHTHIYIYIYWNKFNIKLKVACPK